MAPASDTTIAVLRGLPAGSKPAAVAAGKPPLEMPWAATQDCSDSRAFSDCTRECLPVALRRNRPIAAGSAGRQNRPKADQPAAVLSRKKLGVMRGGVSGHPDR